MDKNNIEFDPARTKIGLDRVFEKWRNVASTACRPGFFGEIVFSLSVREGTPYLQKVTKTDTEHVTA